MFHYGFKREETTVTISLTRRAAFCGGLATALSACLLLVSPWAAGASLPDSWDHLVRVKSKRLYAVYLLPDTDFRSYTKIMLDPVQVAFRKNWVRDYNSTTRDSSRRLTDEDALQLAERTREGAVTAFTEVFRKAGYEIVTAPGPDVLRLAPNIIDLYVTAPEPLSAGRSRTYTVDAGEATLALEAHDALTGALLGRAVDRRSAGSGGTYLSRATDISNTADFERLYRSWADASVKGLEELKARSPLVIDRSGKGTATVAKPAVP